MFYLFGSNFIVPLVKVKDANLAEVESFSKSMVLCPAHFNFSP
jgi:hypothetical protein